jgi:hypothetical protein
MWWLIPNELEGYEMNKSFNNLRYNANIGLERMKKILKIFVRIVGVPAEVRTGRLPNKCQNMPLDWAKFISKFVNNNVLNYCQT